MNQIVDTCPLTKSEGGLNILHKVDDDTVMHRARIYSNRSTHDIILKQVLHVMWQQIIAQRAEYMSVIIVTFVCTCMPTLLAGTECRMEHAIVQEK